VETAMKHPWLNEYPDGVPAEVDVGVHASVSDLLQSSCRRFGELPACSNMGVSISYRDLDRLSAQFAGWLQHVAGLSKGDRVALMLPNLLQYPVALLGVLRAGMTVVNVNPLYTPRELEHQLRDSGAVVVVVLENFAHTLEEVIERTQVRAVVTTQVGDLFPAPKGLLTNLVVKYLKKMVPPWRLANATSYRAALRAGLRRAAQPVALGHDDVAFLQYTGGTTGVAKGAVLTHGNMVANVEQLSAWIARDLVQGKEIVVIPLPLYHVYALIAALVFMDIGAQVLLITNPRELPKFIEELARTPVTAMVGVNTLYNALLNAPGFTGASLGHLKLACAGGMAVQRAVAERWKQATGVPIVEGYGLTETSPVVTSNRLDIRDWTGTAGLPLPSTEVAVVDDDGAQLPTGEVGELLVRGPQVMRGYWNRPDETAKVLSGDGWLRTGDMGFLDEKGYFRLTDRKKDIIVVSGFKVFPNEIEDVVAMHPGVLEVAAIGVPDADSGEAVKIIVVRKDPALTEDELIAHCRKNLTGYKVPRHVEFREQPLPKSNIGKVLRRLLREPAAA
jgi:long-chain acyl-CoA synthetase